jgi:hypothetical protein
MRNWRRSTAAARRRPDRARLKWTITPCVSPGGAGGSARRAGRE